jgi:hypothetical protein
LGANLQLGLRKADNGQQVVAVLPKTQERDMGQLCRGFQIGSIRRVWRVLQGEDGVWTHLVQINSQIKL